MAQMMAQMMTPLMVSRILPLCTKTGEKRQTKDILKE